MSEHPELFPLGLDQKIFDPTYLPDYAFPLADTGMADIKIGQLLAFTAGIRGNNPVYIEGERSQIDPVGPDGGYEGRTDAPSGHGMNAKWVRRCHWAIAMAGGYATYGDWSDGTSYFYMGFPGPGKAALQLKHLKTFFESLPFTILKSSDNLVTKGYCLSKQPDIYVVYLPEGGSSEIDLTGAGKKRQFGRWFDPETGQWSGIVKMERGKNLIQAPEGEDRALLIRNSRKGFKM